MADTSRPRSGQTTTRPDEALQGWDLAPTPADVPPAVIINPLASPRTLLDWGIGHVECVNAVLEVLACGGSRVDDSDAVGVLLHLNQQARQLLAAAHERMERDHG